MDKPFLSPQEAARLLMVAPATLRVWTDKGVIRALTTAGGHRRFPREEVERLRRAGRAEPTREATRRILIVDDEVPITRYLSLLMQDVGGVATAVAHDGFSAGHLVHTFHPDTLLLDLMMPGLDGFQVCRQIKAHDSTRHIRVVAMTGFPSDDHRERILAGGAEVLLTKPLDEDQLFTALRLADGLP